MAYLSKSHAPFGALGSLIHRAVTAVASVPDGIVEGRRHAVAVLNAKSDDELARLGLRRERLAEDVHQHLYYS